MSGGSTVALIVFSDQEDAFGSAERDGVGEFAKQLELALDRIAAEAARLAAAERLAESAMQAITAMSRIVEKRAPYTAGHQARVAELAVAIGRRLGWDEYRLQGLKLGASIHDIGKVHVPAEILNRPGKLDEYEWRIVQGHAAVGAEILKDVHFPWPIREMVAQHHERLDGSGYPDGLSGDAIIPEARVIAVADVVEAIASHRPYRASLGVERAVEEIKRGKGVIYDAQAVEACLSVLQEQPDFVGS